MEAKAMIFVLAGIFAIFRAAVQQKDFNRVKKENQELKAKLGRV